MKIKNPLSSIFTKLIYDKRFTIPFSIIASLIFWLVFMISQKPERLMIFQNIPVTVQIKNTFIEKDGLNIVSDVSSQKFTVTVNGPNYIVSSLKPEDFLLTASVDEVNKAGRFSLKVIPSRNSSKDGYQFVSVEPATIDVTFDHIQEKEFNVVPRIEGYSAYEGLIAGDPVIKNAENEKLKIKGPSAVLESIKKVEAYAKTDEVLTNSQSYNASIILYGDGDKIIYQYGTDGKIYDGKDNIINPSSTYMDLPFTNVKVTVPIKKTKTVDVKASFENLPSGVSEAMIAYSINPKKISIIGAPENIDKIDTVYLAPINYNDISSKNRVFSNVSIKVPEGIEIKSETKIAVVNIDYYTTNQNIRNQKAIVNTR